MTKRLNSKHKVDRRLKVNLWGRPKSPFNTRAYGPGQHGQSRQGKPSDYGIQLQAKQKLKAYYGNINERQFRNIYKKASMLKGDTSENLIGLLEKRLDSFLVHLGFTPTFASAKQLINNKKVYVNKRLVTSPSFCLKPGDIVSFANETKDLVARNIQFLVVQQKQKKFLFYKKLHAEVNYKTLEAVLLFSPQQIHYPVQVDPELVLKALR